MEQDLRHAPADRRHVEIAVPSDLDRRHSVTSSGRRATDAIKMGCPYCGASESAVVRSRGAVNADLIRRRRECAECGERFPTFEAVDQDTLARELAERDRVRFKPVLHPGSQN